MTGVPQDKQIIQKWVDERLRLWQTDRFDILMLTNTENDTPQSGYWDMPYSLETVAQLKQQGKILYAGFGCHFTPPWFSESFANGWPGSASGDAKLGLTSEIGMVAKVRVCFVSCPEGA